MDDMQQKLHASKQPTARADPKPEFSSLTELLDETGRGVSYTAPLIVAHHEHINEGQPKLDELQLLRSLALMAGAGRAEFIAFVRDAGIQKVDDRQVVCNAVLRAVREGRITSGLGTPSANVCAQCGARPAAGKKLLVCGRCKAAKYCSAQCQRAAWASHKDGCARPPSVQRFQGSSLSTRCSDVAEHASAPGFAEPANFSYHDGGGGGL